MNGRNPSECVNVNITRVLQEHLLTQSGRCELNTNQAKTIGFPVLTFCQPQLVKLRVTGSDDTGLREF